MQSSASSPARSGNARGTIVFTVALLGGLALAWYLRTLVLLVYASVLFAILISPLVEWVERWHRGTWKPGRGLAIAAVLLGALLWAALLLLLLLPPLWREATALIAVWPSFTERVLEALRRLPGFHRVNIAYVETYFAAAGGWVLGFAQNLAGVAADFFTVLLVTVYLIAEGRETHAWCLGLIPPVPRQRLTLTLDRAQRRMRGWLLGQSTLALTMGVTSAIVFAALHLPDFYVLALLTALLNFVPILGPIAAAALAGTVAAVQSWTSLAVVLIFFAVYQAGENAYLTPRIMRNAVDLPGLAIIIALAIGASLGGVLGAVLAVPSAALAAELLAEYAQQGN